MTRVISPPDSHPAEAGRGACDPHGVNCGVALVLLDLYLA